MNPTDTTFPGTVPETASQTAERQRQEAEDTRNATPDRDQYLKSVDPAQRLADAQRAWEAKHGHQAAIDLQRRPGESDADWAARERAARGVPATGPGSDPRYGVSPYTNVGGRDDNRYSNRDADGRLPVTYGDGSGQVGQGGQGQYGTLGQGGQGQGQFGGQYGQPGDQYGQGQAQPGLQYGQGQQYGGQYGAGQGQPGSQYGQGQYGQGQYGTGRYGAGDTRDRGAFDARRNSFSDPRDREIVHQVDGRTTALSLELGHDASMLEQLRNQMQLDARDNRVATPSQFEAMTVYVARLRAFAAQLVALCASLDVPLPQVATLPPPPSVPPQRS